MKVLHSFVCDTATIDAGGKLNVMGIFDNIASREFPCVHPSFTYVAGLRFERSEVGKHPFILSFVDYDGKELIPKLDGETDIQSACTHNIIFKLNNILFPSPTTYQIDLVVDKHFVCSNLIYLTRLNDQKRND